MQLAGRSVTSFVVVLLLLAVRSLHLQAGEHHTLRFNSQGGEPATANCLAITPQSDRLAVSTSLGLVQFVDIRNGEPDGNVRAAPVTMGYSKDGNNLLLIEPRESYFVNANTLAKRPVARFSKEGYLGLTLTGRQGKLLVDRLTEGGPAAESGKIKPGDELTGYANGVLDPVISVLGSNGNDVVGKFRGLSGTIVRLQIIPKGEDEATTVLVRRRRGVVKKDGVEFPKEKSTPITDPLLVFFVSGAYAFISTRDGALLGGFNSEDLGQRGPSAFSPDAHRFIMVGKANKPDLGRIIEVYDLQSMSRIFRATYPLKSYFGVRYSPDGKQVFIASQINVNAFDAQTGEFRHGYSLDGRKTDTPQEWKAPPAKESKESEEAFSPAASVVNSVREQLGNRGGTPPPRPKADSIAVSEELLATADASGVVTLWNLADGTEIKKFTSKSEKEVEQLEFTPDGKWLVFYREGILHLVELSDIAKNTADRAP